jgi:hypothetical protein
MNTHPMTDTNTPGERQTPLKLADIASRISAHLKRFENDPVINAERLNGGMRTTPYYHAGAYSAGRYVCVGYISYQGTRTLTKDEAIAYLAWLDAGNVGEHFAAARSALGGENL